MSRHLRELLAWCLLALVCVGVARATTIHPGYGGYPASIEYVSGGAKIIDGAGHRFEGRTWDVPSPRTVRATESGGAPLRIGGNDLALTVRRTIPPSAINKAAAIALRGLAPVAVGLEIWDLYNEVRMRPGTCASGGLPSSVSELICFDEGVAQETSTQYCTAANPLGAGGGPFCATSPQAAVQAAADHYTANRLAAFNACPRTGTWVCTLEEARADPADTTTPINVQRRSRSSDYTGYNGSFSAWSFWQQTPAGSTSVSSCPASIDALDPANSLPAGLPVGPDGKCRTGRYNTPKTVQQAADFLEATKPPTGDQLKEMAQDALARGVSIEGASEREVSGPTSVPGTPTTTTTNGPGGTTTTTKTPTTNYTYNTNTVNYTVVTVTTVTDASGTTTTTEGATPEQTDACKAAPDSLGCSKMGDPGTDAPAWQSRDVVFAPEDLGFAGACPAPESWEVFDMTLAWSYEPVCDVAPIIRLCLLVFASIGAIGVIIKETNS